MSVKTDKCGEVIQFIDGWCWSIAPNGRTVYCGTEDEVKAILVDPQKTTPSPVVNSILQLEMELQKEKETKDGRWSIQRKGITDKRFIGSKRSRTLRDAQPEKKHPRLAKAK